MFLQALFADPVWTTAWPFAEAAALIGLVVVLNVILRAIGDAIVGNMVGALLEEVRANVEVQSLGAADPALDAVLTAKFRDVNRRATHHLTVVRRLATLLFMQMIMVLTQSGFAAIALFFIARQGWSHQENLPLLIVFAVCATAAAVYGALPSAFQMTNNFRANILAYTQLLQLSDSIRTYAYTAGGAAQVPALEFLPQLDRALAANRTIAFAFDTSKLPAISALLSELMDTGASRAGAGTREPGEVPAARRPDGTHRPAGDESQVDTETGAAGETERRGAHA